MCAVPRRARVDWDAVRAAAPLGVARVSRLIALGMPRTTIDDRCRALGGSWRRILPGVVLMQRTAPDRAARVAAALAYAGPSAVLTGPEACLRHGLRRAPSTELLHVLIPATKHRASRDFVVVERTTRLPTPTWIGDVPLAPVTRAVLDTARRMRAIDDVRALIAEAVQRGRCSPAALLAELDAGANAGTAPPRAVLREVIEGARSPAEAWALALWRRSGLPRPSWNVPVRDRGGELLAVPDAWFDDVALAWEIDSHEWHADPAGYARTVRRNTRLTSAGVVVAQTLPSSIRDEPDAVLADLRAAYRLAASRPRPDVHAVPRSA